jgi:hypothetical protein
MSSNDNSTKIYDIIININAMKSLLDKGWQEEFPNDKSIYEEKKDKESVIVSVIGNANKGKSFILAKLSDVDLPSGFEIQTKGLSVKYPTIENKNIILLDTAGFQTPLVENDVYILSEDKDTLQEEKYLNEVTELSRDKQMTECLLQKFVLTQANILICVVGELTYSEQKFLNKIKKDIQDKRLFVVHNLQNFTKKEQVENYIKEILMISLTFKLKEYVMINFENQNENEKKNNLYYLEQFEEDKEDENTQIEHDIVHLIMANDNSEAGKYYNESTIKYLKNQISTFVGIKKFPIEEKLKKFLFNISKEIMEEQIKDIKDINTDDNRIKLDGEAFKLKKCLVDELGINNFVGTQYRPKYRYFKSGDGKSFFIQFIMCGSVSDLRVKVDQIEGNYYFTITGKKNLEKPNDNSNKTEENDNSNEKEKEKGKCIDQFNKREEGPFILDFKVSTNQILLSSTKVKSRKKDNGIITLEFSLLPNDN